MGNIIVTGSTGFLGSVLIPRLLAKGDRVIALVRNPEKARAILPAEVEIIEGDITKPGLGVDKFPQVDKLIHLAAIHRLSDVNSSEIWETNVLGTENVVRVCEENKIAHLFFCSTAYTCARNTYEKTKMLCESMVMKSSIPQKTIFKPSIIMPTEKQVYFGHFIQFVLLVVKVHQRAELIRRYLEGKLKLPVLRPAFRIPGNPEGYLNLVRLDDVAITIAEIGDEGVFWLTNPGPPKLKDLAEWVSEILLVDIKIEPKFQPTPIELAFQKIGEAFLPYTWGDSFVSDLKSSTIIDRAFVQKALINSLLKAK